MEVQQVDESTKPSDRVLTHHRAIAAAAWSEFDDAEEQPLIPFEAIHTRGDVVGVVGNSNTSGSGGGPKRERIPGAGPAPRTKATVAPNVEAAKQRAKTTGEWKKVEALVTRAMSIGEQVLNVDAMKVHGTQELVDQDCTLFLLKDRMQLIKLAANREVGQGCKEKNKELFNKCLQDPYLRDLTTTLLSTEEGCHTVGSITRLRDVLLDLQPNVVMINQLMDNHRNGMALLRSISSCVTTECDNWKSNVQALVKARADEKKALEKAQEKERKAQEALQKRQAAAEKRKVEAAAKKAAAAAKKAQEQQQGAIEDQPEPPSEPGKTRRARFSRQHELSESDPPILHQLRSSSLVTKTTHVEDLTEFVNAIVNEPDSPALLRLKKASMKKVLSVT